MKNFARKLLNLSPRLKSAIKSLAQRLFPTMWASARYVEMANADQGAEAARLRMAWTDQEIPAKQRELVNQQLAAYRRGGGNGNFDVLVQALRSLSDCGRPVRVLEVGCSSGYYSEVFKIAGLEVVYAGCDYSEAFIVLARQLYPDLRFDVQDATALKDGDDSFEVVVSGCCLLHIPEYEKAVTETARVTSHYAIFHRTPVVLGQPNKYYRKLAYGVETVEIHFNEPEFLQLLADNGLELLATYTLDEAVSQGAGSATRTYVTRKMSVDRAFGWALGI